MSENNQSLLNPGTGLLVSVRSAEEAECALQGGAWIIDVKEPLAGSLGRADDAVIQEVVNAVAGRCPVSAALGEWADGGSANPCKGLTYVKWGLAGCQRRLDWRAELAHQMKTQREPQVVLTAYADWQCAVAPSVEEVFALAREHSGSVLLIDTFCKTHSQSGARPTLLDWLPVAWIEDLCSRARQAHVRIALAGCLGEAEIRALVRARPDWYAVRGAVCEGGERHATVQTAKVRGLVDVIRG